MSKILSKIISSLEELIETTNSERFKDDLPCLEKIEIKVLGQFSLMADPVASRKLPLVATRDFDALIKGDWSARTLLRIALAEFNLEYDDLSKEIWLPDDAKFIEMHDSNTLKVSYLSALDALTSKAVKAPDKNKNLISKSLEIYPELIIRIQKYRTNS
jgi:hypothetical protein